MYNIMCIHIYIYVYDMMCMACTRQSLDLFFSDAIALVGLLGVHQQKATSHFAQVNVPTTEKVSVIYL